MKRNFSLIVQLVLLLSLFTACRNKTVIKEVKIVLSDSSIAAFDSKSSIDSTGPAMPRATTFNTTPSPPVPITVHEIQYKMRITYTENGRNDQSPEISGSIFNGNCCVNYGALIMGNQLSGQANVLFTARGRRQWSGWLNVPAAFIPGLSPSRITIRNYINDLPISIVAFKASGFLMFEADGKPHFANGGFGIFELKTIPDPELIWHWKKNCDEGRADYTRRTNAAAQRPAALRQSNPQLYKGLPDFNPVQLKMETWQSYPGENYWAPVKVGGSWRWRAIAARKPFADECATIEKLVLSGQPPAGWE